MESMSKIEKMKFWFKNPYNIIIFAVLTIAFLIRLYYFILTKNQALWWDEAEYAANAIAFFKDIPSGSAPYREIVISFLWGFLYLFYPGEILWRVGQLFLSFAMVWVTYLAGKSLFNKKIGIVAAIFVASNALLIFYTGRLLMYMWGGVLLTLALYLFYEGHINEKGNKWLYSSAAVMGIGIAVYFSVSLAAGIIGFFLILTEKPKNLLKKKFVISAIVFITMIGGYAVFSQLQYGFLHPRLYQHSASLSERATNFHQLVGHFPQFPHLFGWFWIVLLIIGMFISFKIFLMLDSLVTKKDASKTYKSFLFILLWFWVIMAFFTFMSVFEGVSAYEGFILPVFPVVGIFAGVGIMSIPRILKKFPKKLVIVLIILLLLYGATTRIQFADRITKGGIDGFSEIREAGIWIKENSNPDDIVVASSLPQITYYSERKTITYTKTPDEFEAKIAEVNPRYVVLSPYDPPKKWVFSYPQQNPDLLKPIHVIPQKNNPNQAMVVIYEVRYE